MILDDSSENSSSEICKNIKPKYGVCSLKIDNNNVNLTTKLMYYIQTNNLFGDKHRNFILDDKIMTANKPMFFFFNYEVLEITFKESIIYMYYEKGRISNNFNMTEVRFDNIFLESNKNFQHICDFIYMIEDVRIPESPETELCKFIWKENEYVWKYCQTFKKRSMESIYFHKKNEVLTTLQNFMTDEKTYNIYKNLDIPYKKIFLFHGLPGSGKTSFIRALASHFNYNISIVKNVADMDDNSLEWMVSKLRKNTFLVFEDIDCLFHKRETTTMKTNISFSGILNLLDGVSSYDKLVIFITTNHINSLDFAFKRRIDMFVEFSYAVKSEILEMYQKFFGDNQEKAHDFYKSLKNKKVTINTLEKFFIDCMNKNSEPIQSLQYIDFYNGMVNENISNLYS